MTATLSPARDHFDLRQLPVAVALATVSGTVAWSFARVFASDRYVVWAIGAALLAHVVALAIRALRRGPLIEAIASVATLGVYVVLLLPGSGSPGAAIDRARAGWAVVRTDAVPIRATDGAVLLAVLVVWAAAAVADQLAFRRDASLGAIAPGVIVVIWCTALGTQGGQWVTITAFGAASVIFLALQHQALLDRRRTRIGPRRMVDAPGLVVIGVVVGLIAVGLGVAGATALPDANTPLLNVGGLGDDTGNRTYRTSVPPLLDVGDKLRSGTEQELFTVGADRADYWRITALDEYRPVGGGQWTLTAAGDSAVAEGLDEAAPRGALVQDFRIGPLDERWMPAAYRAVRVSRGNTLVVRASSTLVTGKPSVSNLDYRVTSDTPPNALSAAQRKAAAGPVPKDLRVFTETPSDLPEVVRTTAAEITAGLDNPVDRATALRDFFRRGSFTYDPTVELGDDESAVTQFLAQRRGFCVQFASTYALMARTVGLPTRVAVGFTPGTKDPVTGRYRVTSHDAHAWPEVWFSGVGWTHLFDPTPPSSLPGGSELPGEEPPLTQPPPGAAAPAPSPGAGVPSPNVPPQPSPTPAPNPGGGVDIAADAPNGAEAPWALLLAAVAVVLFVAPIIVILGLKARRRARRRDAPDPATAITGAWREALDALADHRVASSPAETPLELARRVPGVAGDGAGPPLHTLASAYTEARYARSAPATDGARSAWSALDALRRALDGSVTVRSRLRARVSPGTLRRREKPVAASSQPEPAGWLDRRRRPSTND